MELFVSIITWFESTHITEQVKNVDFIALFTNPWFVVPFAFLVCYLVYKQGWKDLIIIAILIAIWWVSGTDYMNTLIIGDELQMDKVLPVFFGAALVLGFVIYLFFGRSD